MRLGVDITVLAKSRAGIAQYLNAIDKIGIQLVLFGPRNLLFDLSELRNVELRITGTWRPGISRLICYLKHCYFLKNASLDAFWAPSNFLWGPVNNHFSLVTIHDFVHLKHPETMRLTSRLVHNFFMPYSIKKADVIMVPSNAVKNELIRHFGNVVKETAVIPAASRFRATDNHRYGKGLLYVGSFEPRKNITLLLNAYSLLPQTLRQKHPLTLCGRESWKTKNLSYLIHKYGIQAEVVVVDDADDYELKHLYQNAVCVILPSLYEGFGIPIVEANSFAKPVITSKIGAMEEVLGDGGILINPNSCSEISTAMLNMLSANPGRCQWRQAAIQNSKRFSWLRSAEKMRDVIQKYLDGE